MADFIFTTSQILSAECADDEKTWDALFFKQKKEKKESQKRNQVNRLTALSFKFSTGQKTKILDLLSLVPM